MLKNSCGFSMETHACFNQFNFDHYTPANKKNFLIDRLVFAINEHACVFTVKNGSRKLNSKL